MKKVITLVLAVVLFAVALVGCGEAGLKDGTYRAVQAAADEHGWTEFLEVTVSGGKITAVDFDALNADGDRKSENQEYIDTMVNYGGTTSPDKFYKELEDALIAKQNGGFDAVAGATVSSDSMRKLYAALAPKMEKGDTTEAVVA